MVKNNPNNKSFFNKRLADKFKCGDFVSWTALGSEKKTGIVLKVFSPSVFSDSRHYYIAQIREDKTGKVTNILLQNIKLEQSVN